MKNYVIACIGCTSVIGDSLGAKVGDLLIEKGLSAYVYGTSLRPITSKNLDEYRLFIERYHTDANVIAIDACVGKKAFIGEVRIRKTGVYAGKILNKTAKPFGDLGILGVVAEHTKTPVKELENAPLSLVETLAGRITKLVFDLVETA